MAGGKASDPRDRRGVTAARRSGPGRATQKESDPRDLHWRDGGAPARARRTRATGTAGPKAGDPRDLLGPGQDGGDPWGPVQGVSSVTPSIREMISMSAS